jgi:hypothetical protein
MRQETIPDPERGSALLAAPFGGGYQAGANGGSPVFVERLRDAVGEGAIAFTQMNGWVMKVPVTDKALLARLLFCQFNEDNPNPLAKNVTPQGGYWFKILDTERDAAKALENKFNISQVISEIGKLGRTELQIACAALSLASDDARTPDDMRGDLVSLAEKNWLVVDNVLNGGADTIKGLVAKAVSKNLLGFHPELNGLYRWTDSKQDVLQTGNFPHHADLLANYLLDGTIAAAVEHLAKLKKLTKFKD